VTCLAGLSRMSTLKRKLRRSVIEGRWLPGH
jgi:hypothetical protein